LNVFRVREMVGEPRKNLADTLNDLLILPEQLVNERRKIPLAAGSQNQYCTTKS
jgi:hypothetical protein